MGAPHNFSITLPAEMAEIVHAKVASGEYASASELMQDGLSGLFAQEGAVEAWLIEAVGPAYDRLKADPSTALSPEDVRAALAAEHDKPT
jgi:Arc/MetJ-type ribon-helix-helix transcriptional regulator